jgi:hypothetical protein
MAYVKCASVLGLSGIQKLQDVDPRNQQERTREGDTDRVHPSRNHTQIQNRLDRTKNEIINFLSLFEWIISSRIATAGIYGNINMRDGG